MLKFLPAKVRGSLIFILVWINIILCCIPLYIFAFFRFISPDSLKPALSRHVNRFAELWISINNVIFDLFQDIDIQIKEMPELHHENWYLVLSNHQTWMDIVILQRVFNRRIPMLKFFIKEQLIWIPIIGIAWWALDFPVMKRYSREQLAKNPHLRGKDLQTTRDSCEKFKLTPVSVLNFVEGTRFTREKHNAQGSPYEHLLKPKAGGVAMVVDSLEDQLSGILDVTIVYPDGVEDMWRFLCAPRNRVLIEAQLLPVSNSQPVNEEPGTAAEQSGRKKPSLKGYINSIWEKKDERITRLLVENTTKTGANQSQQS